MSTEENKQVIRQLYEALNRNDQEALDTLIAPEYVDHSLPPGMPPTRESFKQVINMFHAAFPDLHQDVEDLIAESDRVVARSTIRGTHRGTFLASRPPASRPRSARFTSRASPTASSSSTGARKTTSASCNNSAPSPPRAG